MNVEARLQSEEAISLHSALKHRVIHWLSGASCGNGMDSDPRVPLSECNLRRRILRSVEKHIGARAKVTGFSKHSCFLHTLLLD